MTGLVQGLWTLLALGIFIAIVIWAYNPKRRRAFEQAARIALDDDEDAGEASQTEKRNNG